jgi:AraC-like DNA-binding protein
MHPVFRFLLTRRDLFLSISSVKSVSRGFPEREKAGRRRKGMYLSDRKPRPLAPWTCRTGCTRTHSETVHFVSVPGTPEVDLACLHHSTTLWRMTYGAYLVAIPATCAAEVRYRMKTVLFTTDEIAVAEPGEASCVTRLYQPTCGVSTMLGTSVVRTAAEERWGRRTSLHLKNTAPFKDDELRRSYIRWLSDVDRQEPLLAEQSHFASFLQLFLERSLEERAPKPDLDGGRPALERARRYILDHLTESISLEDLAREARLDRFALLRQFSKRYGVPPHEYQLGARIAQSMRWLRKGLSPAHVAVDCGFVDQSHFTRHFKKHLRITPAQYARG